MRSGKEGRRHLGVGLRKCLGEVSIEGLLVKKLRDLGIGQTSLPARETLGGGGKKNVVYGREARVG